MSTTSSKPNPVGVVFQVTLEQDTDAEAVSPRFESAKDAWTFSETVVAPPGAAVAVSIYAVNPDGTVRHIDSIKVRDAVPLPVDPSQAIRRQRFDAIKSKAHYSLLTWPENLPLGRFVIVKSDNGPQITETEDAEDVGAHLAGTIDSDLQLHSVFDLDREDYSVPLVVDMIVRVPGSADYFCNWTGADGGMREVSSTYLVLQKGGTETEWYAGHHTTLSDAESAVRGHRNASYQAKEPIQLPRGFSLLSLEDQEAMLKVFESILEAPAV